MAVAGMLHSEIRHAQFTASAHDNTRAGRNARAVTRAAGLRLLVENILSPSGSRHPPRLCGLVAAGLGRAGPPWPVGRRFGPLGKPHGARTRAH